VGDLSSKFGAMKAIGSNSIVGTYTGSVVNDYNPPLWKDYFAYKKADTLALSWGSVMFHCDNGCPLFCAKLVPDAVATIPVATATTTSLPTVTANYVGSYKATFPGGGWFKIEIDPVGTATYSWYFDLSASNPYVTTAQIQKGLQFHIHTNQTTMCGSTGNHYDPFLACGPKSEFYNTLCPLLGRTASSTPPYSYKCNTTNYAAGLTDFCEVGDLSGKYGDMTYYPGNIGTKQYTFAGSAGPDINPPLPASHFQSPLKSSALGSSTWAEIVFHSTDGLGTKLLCAPLLSTSDSSSPSSTPSSTPFVSPSISPLSSEKSPSSSDSLSKRNIWIIAVSVGGFLFILVLVLIGFICINNRGKSGYENDSKSHEEIYARNDFTSLTQFVENPSSSQQRGKHVVDLDEL